MPALTYAGSNWLTKCYYLEDRAVRQQGKMTDNRPRQLGIRCNAKTPAKLAKLALELGYYSMRHGEKVGAINQLFDAIASGEVNLTPSKGA